MGTLYDRLVFLCEQRGIKGGKMCTDIGVSKSLMTDLKMGRKKGVSAETAQKIALYFGVTVGYLLGEEAEEAPTKAGERSKSNDVLDEVDIAFYGDFKELNEEQKETVRDMVRIMRERRAKQQEK